MAPDTHLPAPSRQRNTALARLPKAREVDLVDLR
jgi:hypothetical protein